MSYNERKEYNRNRFRSSSKRIHRQALQLSSGTNEVIIRRPGDLMDNA